MKVVQQSKPIAIQSAKAENGQLMKSTILLQELGGRYEDQYAATLLGPMAQVAYNAGDLVAVSMRMQAREYNGQLYQDILVQEICKIMITF